MIQEQFFSVFQLFSPEPGVCRGLMMPAENTLFYAALRNSSVEKCKKLRHSKTTCPVLCHGQKDYATKTSPGLSQMQLQKSPEQYQKVPKNP